MHRRAKVVGEARDQRMEPAARLVTASFCGSGDRRRVRRALIDPRVELGRRHAQRAQDRRRHRRVARAALLQRDRGMVLAVADAERHAARRALRPQRRVPGVGGEVRHGPRGGQVGRGHPDRPVGTIGIGDRLDPAVADVAHEDRGENRVRRERRLRQQHVPVRQRAGVATGEFERLEDPRAGLKGPWRAEALHGAAEERVPLVGEGRPEVGRRQHHQPLHRRLPGRELRQPRAHHERAGAVHHGVDAPGSTRQAGGLPRAVHRLDQVVEPHRVDHRHVVAEADGHDAALAARREMLRQALEGAGGVTPPVEQDDGTQRHRNGC